MQVIGNILMFSWIPIVFGIFGLFPPRRAVLISFIAGWMFLPMFGYQLTGFPDYTKVTATSIGVLLAAFIFDGARLFSFRIKLVDLPMFAFCLVPLFSSLNNGLGLYNGLSSCLQQTVTWGLPWYIGRCYFSDLEGMRELAIGIFIGGLVYLPFCL